MRLFKYLNSGRKDVIQNQTMRFTPAKYLNDAFELLPYVSGPKNFEYFIKEVVFPIITSNQDSEIKEQTISEIQTIIPDFNQQDLSNLFNMVELDDVMEFIKPMSAKFENDFLITKNLRSQLDRKFGVLSLTTRIDNPDMWSKYSDDCKGFAVELDSANSFLYNFDSNHASFRFPKNITYSEDRPSFSVLDFNSISSKINRTDSSYDMIAKTFFTKSKEWENEKEIRVLRLLKNANKKFKYDYQDIHLFNFESNLILNVYLGHKCSAEFQKEIISICNENRYSHVSVYKQIIPEKTYGFEYKMIKKGKEQESKKPIIAVLDQPDLFIPINLDSRNGGLVVGISKNRGGIQVYKLHENGNLAHAGDMESFQFVVNSYASIKYHQKLEQMNSEMQKIRKRNSISSLYQKLMDGRESLKVLYAIDERYSGLLTSANIIIDNQQFFMNKYSSLYYYDDLIKMNNEISDLCSV